MSAFDPDAAAAPGSGIFGLDTAERDAAIVLIPVPFAATVSYGGGSELGPSAMLAASHQVDLYDWHFGRIYEAGICLRAEDPAIAAAHQRGCDAATAIIARGGANAGDADCLPVDQAGEVCNRSVRGQVEELLDAGKIVGVLGGDHSVPFGAIQAVAERHPGMGILHIDAHADLRDAYEGFRWSHASIMHNVLHACPSIARLVQVGIRDYGESELHAIHASAGRVLTHFDAEWQRRRFGGETFDQLVDDALAGLPGAVWISVDIDGLNPSLCPNTGTPVPGGLQFAELAHLLARLAASGRQVLGFDLVEVAPGQGEWDANVGARVLYKLCGTSLRSHSRA